MFSVTFTTGQSKFNVSYTICFNVSAEESVRHAVGHFLKRKVLYLVEERLRKMPDDLGHKQTFVARQAFHYGFVKRSAVGLTVRTIIFHKVWSINVS